MSEAVMDPTVVNPTGPSPAGIAANVGGTIGAGVAVNHISNNNIGFKATAAKVREWGAKTGSAVWASPWGKAAVIGGGVLAAVGVVRHRHRNKLEQQQAASHGRW